MDCVYFTLGSSRKCAGLCPWKEKMEEVSITIYGKTYPLCKACVATIVGIYIHTWMPEVADISNDPKPCG